MNKMKYPIVTGWTVMKTILLAKTGSSIDHQMSYRRIKILQKKKTGNKHQTLVWQTVRATTLFCTSKTKSDSQIKAQFQFQSLYHLLNMMFTGDVVVNYNPRYLYCDDESIVPPEKW